MKHEKVSKYYDHDCPHKFFGVLIFHVSNKSNKWVMLSLTSGLDYFETRGIELQEKEMAYKFEFNYLSVKIA